MTDDSDGWFTVTSREAVGDYCAECGAPLHKGTLVQRIDGGYGWRCEAHRARALPGETAAAR